MGDLIELARGDEGDPPIEDVALDALVAEAVARARRHAPGVRFRTELEPCVIAGVPDRLGRAVNNVLDNAAAFSPPGGVVEVALRDGVLEVRDHGPGVAGGRAAGSSSTASSAARGGARSGGLGPRPGHRAAGRRGPRSDRRGRQCPGRRARRPPRLRAAARRGREPRGCSGCLTSLAAEVPVW